MKVRIIFKAQLRVKNSVSDFSLKYQQALGIKYLFSDT